MDHQSHPMHRRQLICSTTIGLMLAVLALLSACGTPQMATNAVPTAQAAATLVATNVPPGAISTAVSAATMAATNVPPGAGATVAAIATSVAPTVNAAAGGAMTTATALAGAAGTPGPEATITGQVTKVDPAAYTFTVQAADGKTYDFLATTNSRVDFTTLASNLVSKQQVTVVYRNTAPPYDVISIR